MRLAERRGCRAACGGADCDGAARGDCSSAAGGIACGGDALASTRTCSPARCGISGAYSTLNALLKLSYCGGVAQGS